MDHMSRTELIWVIVWAILLARAVSDLTDSLLDRVAGWIERRRRGW